MSVFWVKVLAIFAVIAGIVAYSEHSGDARGYRRGYADGTTAGRTVQKELDGEVVKQMQADAKAMLDKAKADNDVIAAQYANLATQWKTYHDAAEATKTSLARDLSARTADNQRLRQQFAAAVRSASGGSCPAAATADQTDPGQRANVPDQAGGVVRSNVEGLPDDPFDAIAVLLHAADDTLTVANECVAATR